MRITFFVLALFIICHSVTSALGAESNAAKSVVKVFGGRANGSGFVWPRPGYVVTSLHIVAGSGKAKLRFSDSGVTRTGEVIRCLKDSDLVLMKVENAPGDIPALEIAPSVTTVDVRVIGFPMDSNQYWIHKVEVGVTGADTIAHIAPESIIEDLLQLGYPSITRRVLPIADSLMPGHSGGPLIDFDNGKVIGICNGGVEKGALPLSWGILASELDNLMESTDTIPASSSFGDSLYSKNGSEYKQIKKIYSGDLDVIEEGQRVQIGRFEFQHTRERTLQELISTTDDPQGLMALINTLDQSYFAGVSRELSANLKFDLYQSSQTSAVLVLPANAKIQPTQDENLYRIDYERGQITLLIVIGEEANFNSFNQQIEYRLANIINRETPLNTQWQIDPSFTYPYGRTLFNGARVRRMAHFGQVPVMAQVMTPWGPQLQHTYQPGMYAFSLLCWHEGDYFTMTALDRQRWNSATNDIWRRLALCVQLSTCGNGSTRTNN
jgi:hypothetical protein